MRANLLSRMVAVVCGMALFGAFASTSANAAYVVIFEEVGPNVEAVGGGSLDLTALQLFDMTSDNAFVFGQGAAELTGPETVTPIDVYVGISGPLSLGPGSSTFGATSGSGDLVGVFGSRVDLVVPRTMCPARCSRMNRFMPINLSRRLASPRMCMSINGARGIRRIVLQSWSATSPNPPPGR